MEPRTPDTVPAARPDGTHAVAPGTGHSAQEPARSRRPLHLHPGFLLLVVAGGIAGTQARYGLGSVLPAPGGWPLPTLVINLAGAFLLGLLLEALIRRGPDAGRLRVMRLLLGTGFMGAFTTYSTLALESNGLLAAGRSLDALAYVGASLVVGFLATFAGIRLASARQGAPE
ncbi:fluoride efflux transporter FluC [Pseudarthrobacter sp. L19]|uniref:fluoride efflux transporter FluC n=1 Tax=Pseudarthrobacter sp. L19 TaxID=3423951 RepID=UPI003D7AA11A